MPASDPQPFEASAEERPWHLRARAVIWRLIVTTVGSCMRYRVTGLAAEGAFFAVLSVPPLIFAMAGAIGYVTDRFPPAQVADVRAAVIDLSERALTESAVNGIIVPTIDSVLQGGRFDVISLGFVLALWSGSRALNVFVDTITIMYGLGGQRGIIKTRALSFGLYVLAMVTGVITIPLVVAGPSLVADWLPPRFDFVMSFLGPVTSLGGDLVRPHDLELLDAARPGATAGTIERVTAKVFLLSPPNVTVAAEDKQRIAEGGFFNQS